jgi:hypothetical protein
MRWGKLNLAVIPLLWWVYAMWRELARLKENEISAGVRVTASA